MREGKGGEAWEGRRGREWKVGRREGREGGEDGREGELEGEGNESIWLMSIGIERLAVSIISELGIISNSTRNCPWTTSDLSVNTILR